jgi:hypothetical protein
MKFTQTILFLTAGVLTSSLPLHSQVKTAAASPWSELKQVVGITEFSVKYSRPSAKERDIYGELVPYDKVWRTGANATTKIAFDTEIKFGGKLIPAGEYVLFSIPGAAEWTVILYGDTKVANAGLYDPTNDVARITAKPLTLANPVESFTIGFDALRDTSATLFIDWATIRVPIEIEMDTVALTLASINSAMSSIDSWTARDFANAASFYAENEGDLQQATQWMAQATKMNTSAYWWTHRYAKMLAKQGKTEAAIKAANESLAAAESSAGGDNGYIKLNKELLSSLK